MVKKKMYSSKSIELVAAGLLIMAGAAFGVHISRIFGARPVVEFAGIGATALGWAIVFLGTLGLVSNPKIREFRRVRLISLIALAAVICEGLLAFKLFKGGLLEKSFMDIGVMFLWYIGLLGIFYVYRKVPVGLAALLSEGNRSVVGMSKRNWWFACTLMLASIILMPIATLFSRKIEIGGLVLLSVVYLSIQIYMCVGIIKLNSMKRKKG